MPDTTSNDLLSSLSAAEALSASDAILVDIRKLPARTASGQTICGAQLRDPFTFGHDDPLTRHDGPIVVFCVHGHEVSQFACALLRVHGRNARYVSGGYEALIAAGAPTDPLSEDPA